MATLQKFSQEQGPVPFLVIDNTFLIGSVDIPEQFPGMVENYLSQGGVDWPDIPGLADILPTPTEPASLPATPEPGAVSPASPTPTVNLTHQDDLTWREHFAHDPAGNTLSVFVLAGMLGALAWAVKLFQNTTGVSLKGNWAWIIPILCAVGIGVAGYLSYVETAEVTAVCGPVGDCNTVQQSEYARLFGFLPIGVLGLVGYAAMIVAWLIARHAHNRIAGLSSLALLGMAVFGTHFVIQIHRLDPLWYSLAQPEFFLVSPLAPGIATIIIGSYVSTWLFKQTLTEKVIEKLGSLMPWFIGLYLLMKLADFLLGTKWNLLGANAIMSFLYLVEFFLMAAALAWFSIKKLRATHKNALYGALIVAAGIILNRFDVTWLALRPLNGVTYFPSWVEIALLVGVGCGIIVVYALAAHFFPLFSETTPVEELPPSDLADLRLSQPVTGN